MNADVKINFGALRVREHLEDLDQYTNDCTFAFKAAGAEQISFEMTGIPSRGQPFHGDTPPPPIPAGARIALSFKWYPIKRRRNGIHRQRSRGRVYRFTSAGPITTSWEV